MPNTPPANCDQSRTYLSILKSLAAVNSSIKLLYKALFYKKNKTMAKNLLKNQNYDGASQTFLQGLHDLKPVELEICGTNFAYGHALSLLKMSLQLGQVLSVAHIEQALRVLAMTIKEDVVSLIDRKACKLFMFLLVQFSGVLKSTKSHGKVGTFAKMGDFSKMLSMFFFII